MKSEEIYTKEVIKNYLKKIVPEGFKIVPGSNPPDYDVYIGKEKYALEITNAETVNSKGQKRREFTEPLFSLSERANQSDKLSKIITNDKTLLLRIKSKIQHFRKFEKALMNPDSQKLDEYIATLAAFPEVEVKVLSNFVDKKKIQFSIGDKLDDLDIQKQITMIVKNIFEEKQNKLEYKKITYPRWLGIKINHFFNGEKFWKQAVYSLNTNYGFCRVFFVNLEGGIYDYQL